MLSTCLRLEVAVQGGLDELDDVLATLFGGVAGVEQGIRRQDEDAVRHLFRVAAGLESPVLGEPEILTQFRQAVQRSEEGGLVSGLFGKLLQSAVSTGRQARELLPASPHASMAAIAAQVAGTESRVAVLGSGVMATAVTNELLSLAAPPAVVVVARSPEKVTLAGVQVWGFERAHEVLVGFPAVVSATSAKQRLVDDDLLTEWLTERTSPLTLVDMAMPPDFTAPPGSDVRYVSIDELAAMAVRRIRRDDADDFVAHTAAVAYSRVADHHHVGPVIGGLMRVADRIVDDSVDRHASRLNHEGDQEVLRQVAHSVARTLLASPVAYLRDPGRLPNSVDALAEAFGIVDE